ncbi:hypothetical protein ACLOJK_030013 [Asimina triloba]
MTTAMDGGTTTKAAGSADTRVRISGSPSRKGRASFGVSWPLGAYLKRASLAGGSQKHTRSQSMEGKALFLVPSAAFLPILFLSASFLLCLLLGRALFPVISTGSLSLALVSASFLLCVLLRKLFEWARPRRKGLPPGSMGWPYIGETLRLYTQDPNTFFSDRIKWYGSIFKTHILGCPPEAAKIVLVSRAHLFNPKFPHGKEMLIGPQALFFHQGAYHSILKKLIQSTLLPSSIKGHVSEIESLVHKMLHSWDSNVINTLDEMKMFAFDVAMLSVFGHIQDHGTEGMKELYYCIEKGYNALPLRLPGTPFHKAMKARRALHEMLRRKIEKRREENKDGEGLLGVMLRSKDEDVIQLNDSQIADNIVGVIFAAHDTTASVLTWVLKYLSDHPNLLDSVTAEQENIRRGIMKDGRQLTWKDTRKMTLTSRVDNMRAGDTRNAENGKHSVIYV